MNNYNNISELIFKYLTMDISSNEMETLNKWREVSENEELFKELCSKENFDSKLSIYKKSIYIRKNVDRKLFKANNSGRFIHSWLKYAAAIVLPVLFGLLTFYIVQNKEVKTEVAEIKIKPGKPQAKLILASGENIALEENNTVDMHTEGGTNIKGGSGTIAYTAHKKDEIPSESLKYNTIQIPTGGEYKLVLSDGTEVWLNSETTIRFPEVFKGKRRIVFLKGEAAFKVAKNKNMPFIVNTDNMKVKVLGTYFNVEAYENELVRTTLVEGSVSVGVNNKDIMLVPGERLSYNSVSKEFVKEEVDTDFIIGWMKGRLVFDNERLEDIMKSISRWYGVKVFYQRTEARDIRFTFDIEKYSDINKILTLLKDTRNIGYSIKNKTIVIK